LAIARRCSSDSGYGMRETSPGTDLMWFLTSVIVVSAFGLPAVMCRAGTVRRNFTIFSFFFNLSNLFVDCYWFNEFYNGG